MHLIRSSQTVGLGLTGGAQSPGEASAGLSKLLC